MWATSVPVAATGPSGGPARQNSRAAPLWPTACPAAVNTKSAGNRWSKSSTARAIGFEDLLLVVHHDAACGRLPADRVAVKGDCPADMLGRLVVEVGFHHT